MIGAGSTFFCWFVLCLFLFSFLIFLFQLIRPASTYFALTQLEKQQTLAAILQGFAAIHSYCSHILRAHLGDIKLPPSYPVWHYTDDFSVLPFSMFLQPDSSYLLNANIEGARLQKISHCTNLNLRFPIWEQEEHWVQMLIMASWKSPKLKISASSKVVVTIAYFRG